ncbi:MAG TPA: SpoIIE family protein phosphatase [Terriglobales bacterium]|nr:SpoIIE family protein phosphatase [Terriglobales bacterium]
MAMPSVAGPISDPGSGAFPKLLLVQGSETRPLLLDHSPFTVGRKAEKDLVITDPRVSRDHAVITAENGEFFVIDQGSKHGTFLNGEKVQRARLQTNDRLEFGARDGGYLVFQPQTAEKSSAREFLSQISDLNITQNTDLEKLALFLEAARKLNTTGVLDEILVTLVESTLRLTGSERGYVFLREPDGSLRLAAGRNAEGMPLLDDKTISHSILDEAINSNSEFLVSDTTKSTDLAARNSIIAYDLRTVICIPLRKMQVQTKQANRKLETGNLASEVMGALYLDARYTSRAMSGVGHDILHAIAREAAALVDNARLVQAEEEARRYQQQMAIAASIQQGLMAVTIPEVPFARLHARNISCKEIGGDFYDAVKTENELSVVIADVCGKGVTAAILASTLQGMVYSHLLASMPLTEIVSAVNRFFCQKHIGEKYATLIIVRMHSDGRLEYVNCGHVPPLVVSEGKVARPEASNVPVGLLADAAYESGECRMNPGDRLLLVTDGVTEAENSNGEFFEDSRLQEVAAMSSFEEIFKCVNAFCAGTPLADDCTMVELQYTGSGRLSAKTQA